MPENNGKAGYLVGVDLGGTKIRGGVFDASLRLLGTAKVSTKAPRGAHAVMERIARCVRDTVDETDLSLKDVRGVGVGAPGAVDGEAGNVIFAPNLGWRDVPLQKQLAKLLGLPVFVENDCNLAALGVHAVELKAKPRHMLGIFVGTGIGGGMILDGELFSGFGHTAGELGHMVLELDGPQCGCGNKGCFEALASRNAMFQRIKAAIKEGQRTVLTEMLEDVDKMRSGDLRNALRRGDKLVEHVVEEARPARTGAIISWWWSLRAPPVDERLRRGGNSRHRLQRWPLQKTLTAVNPPRAVAARRLGRTGRRAGFPCPVAPRFLGLWAGSSAPASGLRRVAPAGVRRGGSVAPIFAAQASKPSRWPWAASGREPLPFPGWRISLSPAPASASWPAWAQAWGP